MRHNFKRGDVVSNFHVEDVTLLKEFNICVYTLRHNSSRARYIHLDSCDMNNSFAIILHTPPVNDKGKNRIRNQYEKKKHTHTHAQKIFFFHHKILFCRSCFDYLAFSYVWVWVISSERYHPAHGWEALYEHI